MRNLFHGKKLVVFDMDGVLADTEPVHEFVKEEMLEQMGVPDKIDFSKVAGLSIVEVWQPVIEKYGLSITAPEIELWQSRLVLRTLRERNIPVSRGLLPLLDALDRRRIRAAVASSSGRFLVEGVLQLYSIARRFAYVVTGTDGLQRKPAPDIYQRALQLAGCAPHEALAIEDSTVGRMAANAAGIDCIGYRNPTSGEQNLGNTVLMVERLEELCAMM
ncbi:MAG: HAD family hydrolase [Intestinibacillus sp.]